MPKENDYYLNVPKEKWEKDGEPVYNEKLSVAFSRRANFGVFFRTSGKIRTNLYIHWNGIRGSSNRSAFPRYPQKESKVSYMEKSAMEKREIRRKLLDHIDQTLQTYCHDCLLYQHFKNEKGRPYAHRFCIHSCTIGEKLQAYGRQLNE